MADVYEAEEAKDSTARAGRSNSVCILQVSVAETDGMGDG